MSWRAHRAAQDGDGHSGARHRARDGGARCGARRAGWPTVTLTIETEEAPGRDRDAAVRLSRHRPTNGSCSAPMSTATTCGESAMDNASGLAAVLAVTRALAPHVARLSARPARDVLQRRGMGAHRLGAVRAEPVRRRSAAHRAQRQSRLGRRQPQPRGADAAALPASSRSCCGVAEAKRHRAAHRAAADDKFRPRQLRPGRHPGACAWSRASTIPAPTCAVVLTPADTRDKVGAGRAAPGDAVHRRPGCRRLQRRSGRSREVAEQLVIGRGSPGPLMIMMRAWRPAVR